VETLNSAWFRWVCGQWALDACAEIRQLVSNHQYLIVLNVFHSHHLEITVILGNLTCPGLFFMKISSQSEHPLIKYFFLSVLTILFYRNY
jgi:non-ribosomal peptide synthetase component E (peptide arylation enzyme)